MAVTSVYTGQYLKEIRQKLHDEETDNITVCLMDTSFVFNKDTMTNYTDHVLPNEIATGYGYTRNTKVLTTPALAYSAVTHKVTLTGDTLTWTATGGDLPAVMGACLVINGTLMLYIDFDATYITANTKLFQLNFANGVATATVVG